MSRIATVKQTIRRVLARCTPFALPEDSLWLEVNSEIRPVIGRAEFNVLLEQLMASNQIGFITDPDDTSVRKFHLKEAGRAILNN